MYVFLFLLWSTRTLKSQSISEAGLEETAKSTAFVKPLSLVPNRQRRFPAKPSMEMAREDSLVEKRSSICPFSP
jgi:hypothetical protein